MTLEVILRVVFGVAAARAGALRGLLSGLLAETSCRGLQLRCPRRAGSGGGTGCGQLRGGWRDVDAAALRRDRRAPREAATSRTATTSFRR